MLAFRQVSKWYGPVIGLNDVTLELQPGLTGLVGPNGAGKSTLMKLATGQLLPDAGRVTLAGHAAWSAAAKRVLGFCPDTDAFYEEMSGRQFVRAMAGLCGYSSAEAKLRTEAVLERVGMADRADRRVRGYSKGMRQRVKLAQALVHDPELLILDEPFNGIDPVGRVELQRLLNELASQGKSILISSHQLDELEKLTERIVVIARGMLIASGTVAEIRALLDEQPLSIRVECDRPRHLAGRLLGLPETLGVELEGQHGVIVRARQPQAFHAALGQLILEEGYELRHLETLDCTAQAVLDYLLKSR